MLRNTQLFKAPSNWLWNEHPRLPCLWFFWIGIRLGNFRIYQVENANKDAKGARTSSTRVLYYLLLFWPPTQSLILLTLVNIRQSGSGRCRVVGYLKGKL